MWNWPLRDDGLRAWLVIVLALALVAIVWAVGRDPLFTSLTIASFTICLWRMWIPVRWELNLSGITMAVCGFRRRIPWMAIARYELRPDGVWLYADREASPSRSTFIGYGGERERITAMIEYYLGRWTAATESTQTYQAGT